MFRLAFFLGLLLTSQSARAQEQSCPVAITRLESSSSATAGLMAAMVGAGSSNTYLILKYQNNSKQPVTGVRFVVAYLNSVREPIDTENITTPIHKLKPGKSMSFVRADESITGGLKMELLGWVAKVMFSDGTAWEDNGKHSCISVVK